MKFVWDEVKNVRNQAKHRLSFENASRAFEDPSAVTLPDRFTQGEERWNTIGLIGGTVVLVVAHTYVGDDDLIRIISARRATRGERRKYEQNRQGIEARY